MTKHQRRVLKGGGNVIVCAARYYNHALLGSHDRVSAIQEPRDQLACDPENCALLLLS
jgi:hypothetical protein